MFLTNKVNDTISFNPYNGPGGSLSIGKAFSFEKHKTQLTVASTNGIFSYIKAQK